MTSRRASTAPNNQVVHDGIDPVMYDTSAAAPLSLKYPNGLLMPNVFAEYLFTIQSAARETKTPILIVTGKKLNVYYTADGQTSSVPDKDPVDFFETFRRLQVEHWQYKGSKP